MSLKQLSLIALSLVMGIWSALAQSNDEQLQKILQLLDQELAQWEAQQQNTPTPTPSPATTTDANELATAIATIHGLGITKYDTVDTYMWDNTIRRDEGATMFFRFASKTNNLSAPGQKNCDFPDLDQAHSDLIGVVKDSCRYGLFKGARGYFLPTSNITNAQAITVMSRVLAGFKDETGVHWADQYFAHLTKAWYLKGLAAASKANYDRPITRGDIAILLARVYEKVK